MRFRPRSSREQRHGAPLAADARPGWVRRTAGSRCIAHVRGCAAAARGPLGVTAAAGELRAGRGEGGGGAAGARRLSGGSRRCRREHPGGAWWVVIWCLLCTGVPGAGTPLFRVVHSAVSCELCLVWASCGVCGGRWAGLAPESVGSLNAPACLSCSESLPLERVPPPQWPPEFSPPLLKARDR